MTCCCDRYEETIKPYTTVFESRLCSLEHDILKPRIEATEYSVSASLSELYTPTLSLNLPLLYCWTMRLVQRRRQHPGLMRPRWMHTGSSSKNCTSVTSPVMPDPHTLALALKRQNGVAESVSESVSSEGSSIIKTDIGESDNKNDRDHAVLWRYALA